VRLSDKTLVILSRASLPRPWVEREVQRALKLEDETGKTKLFPVRIDSHVFKTDTPWAVEIADDRHIFDLSQWRDPERYRAAFDSLLSDLKRAT
jgi:hypothetical protein